jgi:hypothetical protein
MKRRIGRRRAPLRFVKLKPGHKATSEELVAPINNPTHWRQRAEEARELAS